MIPGAAEPEYRALLDASGFSVAHVGSTSGALGLLTAVLKKPGNGVP